METWDELDALVSGIRKANEEWAKSADELQKQLDGFRDVAEQIERHFADLAVYDAMCAVSRRILNDAARIHLARLNYGLTRSAAMLWYPMDDPRKELSSAPPDTVYSLEVRIGPRYLLGAHAGNTAGDQRMSILIAGEKQLLATLPTTAERFQSALLQAFDNPQRSRPAPEAETAESPADDSEGAQATTDGTAAEGAPSHGPSRAEPAPSEAAGAREEPTEAPAAPATSDGEARPRAPEAETVIELPGATKASGRKRTARQTPSAGS